MDLVFWIVIAVICGAVELHTRALVAVFVGLGAIVAGAVSLFHTGFALQAVIWVLMSALSMMALRSAAVQWTSVHRGKAVTGTTTDSTMVGLRALVKNPIGGADSPGTIVIRSESWKAVSEGPLEAGSHVIVTKVSGTTLWVAAFSDHSQ